MFYLISGLPRRSCLTARNDDVAFYFHVSRHCEERSNPENMEKLYLINNTKILNISKLFSL